MCARYALVRDPLDRFVAANSARSSQTLGQALKSYATLAAELAELVALGEAAVTSKPTSKLASMVEQSGARPAAARTYAMRLMPPQPLAFTQSYALSATDAMGMPIVWQP